jgi:hypothetical protein
VGALPVKDNEELKRTNEIKMAIPLLNTIDLEGKDVTADALLTQRKIAEYLVTERHAHYHFTIKGNQRGVLQDVASNRILFSTRPLTMDESKFERSGPPSNSMTTLIFPTLDRRLPSNGNSQTKRVASALVKWPTASPVERQSKQTQSVSSILTVAIGRLKIVVITSSIGTTMKTGVESVPATARRISHGCADSPSGSSNPKRSAVSHKKCES